MSLFVDDQSLKGLVKVSLLLGFPLFRRVLESNNYWLMLETLSFLLPCEVWHFIYLSTLVSRLDTLLVYCLLPEPNRTPSPLLDHHGFSFQCHVSV
jgi:hypothetical protein